MKRVSISILSCTVTLLLMVFLGCNSQKNKLTLKEHLIKVATDYASKQLRNPEVKTLQDSTVMIGDTSKRYFIQTSGVFTGLIDGDDRPDGIVSMTSMAKRGGRLTELLIILNSNDKYLMVKSVESDMKILSLKDRVITAEVPTHPVNNPLHDCPVCIVVERFRFENGGLTKLK